jgi:hypothetical protein
MMSHSYPTTLSAINAQLAECVDELRVLGANVQASQACGLTSAKDAGLSDDEREYIALKKKHSSVSARLCDDADAVIAVDSELKIIDASITALFRKLRAGRTSLDRIAELDEWAKRA